MPAGISQLACCEAVKKLVNRAFEFYNKVLAGKFASDSYQHKQLGLGRGNQDPLHFNEMEKSPFHSSDLKCVGM